MKNGTCAVVDRAQICGQKLYAREMCEKHYQRWRKHGDPLVVISPRGVPLAERFWAKVDKNGPTSTTRPDLGPCWLWTTGRNHGGYGVYLNRPAHKVAYELVVASVPDGLQLDHLCRTRACVNPTHLEPVTALENQRRAKAARTHCKRGHEFTPENTRVVNGARKCRLCINLRAREYSARKRAKRKHANDSGLRELSRQGEGSSAFSQVARKGGP